MTSTYEGLQTETFESGANLNGQLHRALKFDNTGRVVLADTASEHVIGILAHDPQRSQFDTDDTTGDVVTVARIASSGKLPMISGGVIAAGDYVGVDANAAIVSLGADLTAIAADAFVLGQAEAAAVADQVVAVVLSPTVAAGT